jgi:phosphohistidine phosphatase
MRRLMLLRHAKSDWSAFGAKDHDRTLALRGRQAAPRIGAYMAAHGFTPDRAICSTALRARETWDLVSTAFAQKPPVLYDDRLYDAGPDRILSVARETADDVRTLLLVGHNPGLKDLAEQLIAAGDADACRQLSHKLPTGGLVVIDFATDAWKDLQPQSGRLDRLVTPRTLEAPD